MAQLNAYLHFNGDCREAMNFYKSCLGGELELMAVGESPMAAQMPPGAKNNIMHSLLKSGSLSIMASDWMSPGTMTKGNNISLSLSCSSNKEADALYAKLSAGGTASHPLKDEFFGYFGDLKDKFGITWMVNVMKPQS
jgi:PhnB protein